MRCTSSTLQVALAFGLSLGATQSPLRCQACPGGEFMTGAVGAVLKVTPSQACTPLSTWYNPNLFVDSYNALTLVAQSDRERSLGTCSPAEGLPEQWDRWFSARQSSPASPWISPTVSSCPYLEGGYIRDAGYVGTAPPVPLPQYNLSNPGPIGDSDVVSVGKKYYMLFNGGNGDFIVGRAYWAVSPTGTAGTWSVYNINSPTDEIWAPLVRDRDHDARNGISSPLSPLPPQPGGITETHLAYDPAIAPGAPNGYFYLMLGHYGVRQVQGFGSEIDSWAIRIAYDPSSAFGLSSHKEIWSLQNGVGGWRSFDSGLMVWDFDHMAAVPGEPILSFRGGLNPDGEYFSGGGGALRRDEPLDNWLHVKSFDFPNNGTISIQSQRSISLSENKWSLRSPVCVDSVTALIPAATPLALKHPYEAGLYFGLQGNRTGWWMYTPIDFLGCTQAYVGLGIVPAELCTTTSPMIASVTPSAGGGSNSINIVGTGLDCASSVTFGGAAARIVSRASGLLQVTAPPHAGGAVSVVVTTPSGFFTKPSGYNYNFIPTYSGFLDLVTCSSANGWAWNSDSTTNNPIDVDIYDGINLLGTVSAYRHRDDLALAGIGNGNHAFIFNLPPSILDGAQHSITVKYGLTGTAVTPSRSIQCILPTLSVSASDKLATEVGPTTATFKVTRTGSTTGALPFTISIGGTASASDFNAIATSQTIPAGQSFVDLILTPVNDSAVENDETVVASLEMASTYLIGSTPGALATIVSDDSSTLPQLTIATLTSPAAESPLVTGAFRVTRTGSTSAALPFTISRAGSASSGSDYNAIALSQSIPVSQDHVDLFVTPINDTTVESDETVVLTLQASPSTYSLPGPTTATVVIVSEDVASGATVTISAADAEASERPAQGGQNTGTFRISRAVVTSSALVVNLGTPTGTAMSSLDYSPLPLAATIPANLPSVDVVLSPIDDGNDETGPEFVDLAIASGSYTIGSPSTARVTIYDNDYSSTPCVPSSTVLCLQNGRFMATLTLGGINRLASQATTNSGFFSLAVSPLVYEVGVKILDDGAGRFSVIRGRGTDSSTILHVTDLANGLTQDFTDSTPFCQSADTSTFPSLGEIPVAAVAFEDSGNGDQTDVAQAACTPSSNTLCLFGDRFKVQLVAAIAAVESTSQTGYFRLGSTPEPDIFVKVLSVPAFNSFYWVYFGSLTSSGYSFVVTDTQTGTIHSAYSNSNPYCGGGDTMAFPFP